MDLDGSVAPLTREADITPRRPRNEGPRVLLLSMRNLAHHVSRCSGYEFEDIIGESDSVRMIAPGSGRENGDGRVVRGIKRILGTSLIEGEMRADKEYDLFFVFCHSASDLQ